jgi:hypothetical protein
LTELDPVRQVFPGGQGRRFAQQIRVDVDVEDRVRAGSPAGKLAQYHARAAAYLKHHFAGFDICQVEHRADSGQVVRTSTTL